MVISIYHKYCTLSTYYGQFPWRNWRQTAHVSPVWLKLNHCDYCALCSNMLYMTRIYIWPYMTKRLYDNIGLAKGLLADGNKLLPKPIWTSNMICGIHLGTITLNPLTYPILTLQRDKGRLASLQSAVYSIQYTHGLVVPCYVMLWYCSSYRIHRYAHICQWCFTGTGPMISFCQCQCTSSEGYGCDILLQMHNKHIKI